MSHGFSLVELNLWSSCLDVQDCWDSRHGAPHLACNHIWKDPHNFYIVKVFPLFLIDALFSCFAFVSMRPDSTWYLPRYPFLYSNPTLSFLDNNGKCKAFSKMLCRKVPFSSKCSLQGLLTNGTLAFGGHHVPEFTRGDSQSGLLLLTSFPTQRLILPGARNKRTAQRKKNVFMAWRVLGNQHTVHEERAADTHIYTFLHTERHLDQWGLAGMKMFPHSAT